MQHMFSVVGDTGKPVCRQTLDTVHLEVGGLVIQIDYDDFVE